MCWCVNVRDVSNDHVAFTFKWKKSKKNGEFTSPELSVHDKGDAGTPDPASYFRQLASSATLLREPQISHLKLQSFFTSAVDGGVRSASRPVRWAPGNELTVPTEQDTRWTPKSVWTFSRRKKYIALAHVQRVLGITWTGRDATTHFHVMSVAVPPLEDVSSWRVALLNKEKCYWINNCHNSRHCEMLYWSYRWMADMNISSCTSRKTLTQHNTIRLNREHCTGVLLLMQQEYHTAQKSYA